jgi:hypothetical protein
MWTDGRLTDNLSRCEARPLTAQTELRDARQQLALRVSRAWNEVLNWRKYKLQTCYESNLHAPALARDGCAPSEQRRLLRAVWRCGSQLSTLQDERDAF